MRVAASAASQGARGRRTRSVPACVYVPARNGESDAIAHPWGARNGFANQLLKKTPRAPRAARELRLA